MSDEQGFTQRQPRPSSGQWIAGLILIGIGVLVLLSRFVESDVIGLAVLPGIGVAFLPAGIASRRAGYMVPAGILIGLGVGVILVEGGLAATVEGVEADAGGGVITLCLGGGFVLVTVLSALFTDERMAWALIPGGILALIGGMLVLSARGFEAALEALRWLGPLALVALGVWLLLRYMRAARV